MSAAAGRRAWLGFLVVCLGSLVAPLDTTVNTAFPVITGAFGLPAQAIQWVVIPFVLAQSSLALVCGHLGDRFGHRRVFAWGLAASAVAHLAVAMAPDFGSLVALRVVQGAAVGVAVACAPALATLLFAPGEKARVLVWYAAVFSLATAVGPWLGGLLLQAFGWPGVFWFRAPLALLAFVLLPWLAVSERPAAVREGGAAASRRASAASAGGFDWGGAIGLSLAMSCLVLGFAELTRPTGSAWLALSLLAAGAGVGAWFVRHELRVPHPVLRMEPFRSARFSGVQGASVAVNLACFGNLLLIPYVLTERPGASIAAVGLALSAYPAGSVLGSLAAGAWRRRRARPVIANGASGANGTPTEASAAFEWPARLMKTGLLVAALGLLAIAGTLAVTPHALLLALCMFASGIGQGLFQAGYMDATTTMLPIEERGVAGSLFSVTRLLGIVFGATGIGWLQAVTGNPAQTFLLLGIGLGAVVLAFERSLSTGDLTRTLRS
jgi:MFS family permease